MTASSMQLNRETLPLEEDELAGLSRKTPTEIIHSGHFMVSDIDDTDNTDEVARASESDCATEVPNSLATPLNEVDEEITFDADEVMEVDKHFKPPCHIAIDGSLTKLFECMTLAYSGKLTSPKWKTFKGLKLRLKDKIRLNNIIWRAWHMQFVARRSPYVCQFASPLEGDTHNKPEAIVMEGKYWKRNFSNITAEYKKWRMFFCKKNSRFRTADDSSTNPVDLDLRWLSHGGSIDEDFFMDLSESLFSSLNQPFDFPNPREIATRAGIADFIQPGLIQLQPAFDDFMDTLEPLSDYFNSKLPTLPEESSLSTEGAPVQPFGMQQQQRPTSVYGATSRQQPVVSNHELQQPPPPTSVQPQAPQRSQQMQPLQGQAAPFAPALSPQQPTAVSSIEGLMASAAQQQQQQQQQQKQQQQQPSPPAAALGEYEFLRQAPAEPMILTVEQAAAAPPQQAQAILPGFAAQQTAQLPLAIAPRPPLATMAFGAEVPQYVPKQPLRPPPKLMPRPSNSPFQPTPTELQVFPRAPASTVPPASMNGLRQGARLVVEHHAGDKAVQGGATAKRLLYPASQETMESMESQYSSRSSSSLMGQVTGGFMPAENTAPAAGKNISFAMPKVATHPKNRTRSRSMSTPQSNTKISAAAAAAPVAKQASSLNQLPQVNSPPQMLTPKLSVSVSSLPGSMPSNSISPPLQQSAVLTQLLTSGNGFSWEAQAAGGSPTANSTGGSPSPSTVTIINSVAPSLPATVAQPQTFVISPVTLSQISSTNNLQRNLIVGSASIMPSSMPTIPPKQLNPTVSAAVVSQAKTADVPAASVSASPVKPFRPKSDEERFQYKEHRRVCHINAEQKRRFNIKNGFESLRHLLPSLSQNPDSKVSKAQMLQQAGEYIRTLKNERQQQQEEADRLKKQIESYNQAISLYQNQLPATGVPLPCQRTNHLKESFEEYVRTRTLQNWKFWIFSLLLEPLLESYNQTVSKAGFDEMCKTVLVWVEQNCSLRALRPGVLDSLRYLSKSTNILSDPSRLPEEATQAVTKKESAPQFKFSTQRQKER
ncbi:carbohydrate-responsive element-binding protein [Dermacentor albipictus]|uniref:carbohydrate-responsive element-binding protein n=1 Tax=Dermacentor albipictus TaxID=60249 RepID=UPI0031FC66B7